MAEEKKEGQINIELSEEMAQGCIVTSWRLTIAQQNSF